MFKTLFFSACAAAVLFVTTGAMAAPADDAKTHFQAIGSGDLAVVMRGHADNAQFNWVGGPLDGTYTSSDMTPGTWEKLMKSQGALNRAAALTAISKPAICAGLSNKSDTFLRDRERAGPFIWGKPALYLGCTFSGFHFHNFLKDPMTESPNDSRRDFLKATAVLPALVATPWALAQATVPGAAPVTGMSAGPDIATVDRVFITNEDSNTIAVINPASNTVDTTINLTSFDEDARPPFRFVTGGVMPTHAAMIHKPLYHGCIDAHGAVPNPDGTLLATSGRGSSNIYLIDTVNRRVVGNVANPQAGPTTNPERLSSGILLGREPHEPTFTRNGKELWVTLRGEDRVAILDVSQAMRQLTGQGSVPSQAVRAYVPTLNGPAQVWFSKDGQLAFVISQKAAQLEILQVNPDANGHSRPKRLRLVDLSAQDKPAFTPFQKLSPDGSQMWLSHKLADAVSIVSVKDPGTVLATLALGEMARPNHLEFVDNARGQVTYMSLARVDDGGPNGAASSRLAIIDRSVPLAQQKVVGMVYTGGREAHGLWTNPANNLLYVAHEQDELPGTPNAGQVVCSAFDVSTPLQPKLITQIPLGSLKLPSGELRNKKSINLVYVRPGTDGQTA